MIKFLAFASALLMLSPLTPRAAEPRPLAVEDLDALREVSDPQISPEGDWVAYTVETVVPGEDRHDSDVWMTRWDGSSTLRITTSKEKEHTPRFSPDGRFLAFLSDRDNPRETDQVWLLDRAGGEALRLTDLKGEVEDYAWSPDGARLAIIAEDPDPDAPDPGTTGPSGKRSKPIVLDRFQFKEDERGYLGARRRHLYLFDVAARKAGLLTPGAHDESLPSWSPDGGSIAFVTKRGADPDRHNNWDVYAIEARPGAEARQVTTNDGPDCDPDWESRPVWSPDGASIAYLQGGPQSLIYYAVYRLAVVPAAGGPPRILTPGLDRNVSKPRWSTDGRSILFLLEDDRSVHLARVPAGGGKVERLLQGRRVVSDLSVGREDRVALLSSTPQEPPEVFALDGAATRPLSRQNRELMAAVRPSDVEEITFKSKDGTPIGGLVMKPPGFRPGVKYPAILRIHGGPVGQYGNEFMLDWQVLAAHGYVVVGANPRGSSGRGEEFQKAIYADWGQKDAQDVLAAVDTLVARGIADPGRLGIGGWSYGGMLTNYTIAQDTRFKAATSGAGISNILAGYGTDMYIREYEAELGLPWRGADVWLRLSFPFLHADRITTPTLFLCGDRDFNVPLLNSEQMYQALRSLGRDTALVIYPGEYHGIARPSFRRDRLQRYLGWYGRYLMPKPAAGGARPAAAGRRHAGVSGPPPG